MLLTIIIICKQNIKLFIMNEEPLKLNFENFGEIYKKRK